MALPMFTSSCTNDDHCPRKWTIIFLMGISNGPGPRYSCKNILLIFVSDVYVKSLISKCRLPSALVLFCEGLLNTGVRRSLSPLWRYAHAVRRYKAENWMQAMFPKPRQLADVWKKSWVLHAVKPMPHSQACVLLRPNLKYDSIIESTELPAYVHLNLNLL